MKLCHHLYFITIIFLFSKPTYAQKAQLDFNLVSGSNGISVGKITGITQDKFGYMWFVDQTNNCLIRFDGVRMRTYRNNPSDTNSLDGRGFECIAADSTNGIWVNAAGGVDKFDPYTGKFIHYRYPKNEGRAINNILVDHLGIVWLGTSAGLDRLDQKTGKFIHYPHKDNDPTSLSCNIVRALYEDHEGTLWVGTGLPFDTVKEGGLNKFNREKGTFIRYMHDPNNPHSLINDKIRAIFEDSRGVFWVGTQGDGLHIMDRKTGSFTRLTYDPSHPEKLSRPPVKKGDDFDHITFIMEDMTGAIWIGTYLEGLVKYDPVTKEIEHFKSDQSRTGSFKDSTTWCAFKSNDGALWIATETSNLLFRVDPLYRFFQSTSTGNAVNYFLKDKEGYLWVSTAGSGLIKFDSNKSLVAQFKHDPSDTSSLLTNHVGPLFQKEDDTIWVGTFNGIQKFNKITQKFYKFGGVLKDSGNNGFAKIYKDRQGFIWLGNWGLGLIRYNPSDNSLKYFRSNAEDSTSISSNFVTPNILEDSLGVLWIGTNEGINCLNRQTGKFNHYLAGLFIGCLYEDSRGILWAGTEKGLFSYDKKNDRFTEFFDTQSILNVGPIGGITEDNGKNLWFNSFSAIIKLNPVTKETFIYGSRFGIIPNSLAPWVAPYKNEKGQLFFGHQSGFYTFYPEELAVKTDFKTIITDLFINNLSVLPGKKGAIQKPVEEIRNLVLKYNQNNIAFNFAAIDYRKPEAIKYFTMLEGYDNTWREAKEEKSSYYFNLSRGKYVYRVKAFNSDGTKAESAITIRINPPWWETWWAYILYAILFIGAVWAFIKWRTRALHKEKIILEQKVAGRTKELKEEKELVESTLSELKSTQAQLIQSEKMASLGELTAGIAHEIQNPLNFVNNFSEINKELLDEMENELKAGNIEETISIAKIIKENEEKINHHGKRADGIVKGMLQHSRSSSGVKESTDINALADEYLRLAYHGLRAKDKFFNATMKTDFDETIGNINIIPQDIGRVILNLITNAFYAVTEKKKQADESYEPTVSVSTKKTKNKVEVKVKDNGNGIPQKVLDKIFQPFFTTKPTGQGTGLGLSLSYDIIKAHGGEIKVETKEGEGSEFYIVLPI